MDRETKVFECQVKALGTKANDVGQEMGQISCYSAVFNVVDEGKDRILPGAFKRSLKNSATRATSRGTKYIIPMLYQHDTHEIIGGWHTITEDAFGLKCEGDINLATQRGREYWELARAGMSSSFSIIYDCPAGGAKFDKSGVRELSELRLFSCDPVTFPMCDETILVAVKATDANRRARTMPDDTTSRPRQRKTFQEHYNEQQCKDLLRDWQDVVLAAFTSAVYDAFTIGDEPEPDVNAALDGLKTAVTDWVGEAVKYDLCGYIESQSDTYSGGTESRMQNGTTSSYGYYGMSRNTPMHAKAKAMTASDATTGGFTADHVSKLQNAAAKATKAVEKHVGALQDSADTIRGLMAGVSGSKASVASSLARHSQALSDHADDLESTAATLTKSMTRHIGTVNTVADDLATILQGSEAAYGTEHGTPAPGRQEGKSREGTEHGTERAPSHETRAPQAPPSPVDTVSEEDIAGALSTLRSLRKSAPAA